MIQHHRATPRQPWAEAEQVDPAQRVAAPVEAVLQALAAERQVAALAADQDPVVGQAVDLLEEVVPQEAERREVEHPAAVAPVAVINR